MKRLFTISMVLIFSFVAISGPQKEDTYAMLKAVYIYNFTKNFDWPEKFKSGPFIIGVLGESNIYDELTSKYSTKSVGKQKIEIKKFSNLSEVDYCHILFVSEGKSTATSSLAKQNTGTLIISEKSGFLQQGGVVNFVVVNSKLEFELSKTNASKYNLSVGSQLQNLAMSVE